MIVTTNHCHCTHSNASIANIVSDSILSIMLLLLVVSIIFSFNSFPLSVKTLTRFLFSVTAVFISVFYSISNTP